MDNTTTVNACRSCKQTLKCDGHGRKNGDVNGTCWVNENDEITLKNTENKELLSSPIKLTCPIKNEEKKRNEKKTSCQTEGCDQSISDISDNETIEECSVNSPTKCEEREDCNKKPDIWDLAEVVNSKKEECLEDSSSSEEKEDYTEDPDTWDVNELLNVKHELKRSCYSETSNCKNFENSSDSDWENEPFEDPNVKRTYMHPTESEQLTFVPSDIHARLISRSEVWNFIEEGQFDDADL